PDFQVPAGGNSSGMLENRRDPERELNVSAVSRDGRIGKAASGPPLRIAAAADLHCREANRAETAAAFAELDGKVDLLLLAGDLTTVGEPGEAAVLADACRPLKLPTFAVLGNHDWHAGRHEELTDVLEEGG